MIKYNILHTIICLVIALFLYSCRDAQKVAPYAAKKVLDMATEYIEDSENDAFDEDEGYIDDNEYHDKAIKERGYMTREELEYRQMVMEEYEISPEDLILSGGNLENLVEKRKQELRESDGYNPTFRGKTDDNESRTWGSVAATCSECGCSEYIGYKHINGYEGDCSGTDRYGYKCGHSPTKHGLKKW